MNPWHANAIDQLLLAGWRLSTSPLIWESLDVIPIWLQTAPDPESIDLVISATGKQNDLRQIESALNQVRGSGYQCTDEKAGSVFARVLNCE